MFSGHVVRNTYICSYYEGFSQPMSKITEPVAIRRDQFNLILSMLKKFCMV